MVSCFSFCHILRNGSCIMKPVRTLTPLVIRRWVEIKTFFCCGPIQPTTTEFFSTVTMRTAEQEGSGIVAELSRTGWTTGREKKKVIQAGTEFRYWNKAQISKRQVRSFLLLGLYWRFSMCWWQLWAVCVSSRCGLCSQSLIWPH